VHKRLWEVNAIPFLAWRGLEDSRRLRLPEFQDNQHIKVVRFSGLGTDCLYPHEISLVLISVGGCVDSRTMLRPEGLIVCKVPINSSGIEPATFWLVAQYLSQLSHRVG